MAFHRASARMFVLLLILLFLVPAHTTGAQVGDPPPDQSLSGNPPPHRAFLPSILGTGSLQNQSGTDSESGEAYSRWLPFQPPQWLGPHGGSVVALAADPNNPSVLYAGSWGAGVYKSTNGGMNWVWAGQGIENQYIDSLAVDPVQPEILYAGTHGAGVFKSTDAGLTWQPARQGMQAQAIVYTVTVSSGNNNLIYAGTRSGAPPAGPPWRGILYKSTNGGASWSPVLSNVGGSAAQDWVYSVRVNPNSPDIVLAATHEHGPYYADNYGGAGSWRPVPSGAGDMAGRAVAFDPRSWTGRAFYATWHGAGVYRSTNSGQSWTSSNTGLDYAKVYPNGIAIAPGNPDVLYLATFGETTVRGVMKSTNTGETWRQAGLGQDKIYSVAVGAGSVDTLYAGTYGNGLFKSTDGGSSWTRREQGLTNTSVNALVEGVNGILLASVPGSGVMRSTDGGRTWAAFNHGLAELYINGLVRHPANPSVVFALTNYSGLRRYVIGSSDGWTPTALIEASAPPVATSADDPFARHEPMEEWARPEAPAAEASESLAGVPAPVLCLTFAPSSNSVAYLGTNGSGVYRSTDTGSSWTPAGLTGLKIRSIAVSPKDPNTVYAAGSAAGQVKVTQDGGQTWRDIPLPGVEVYSLAVSPVRGGGIYSVYAATSSGIWMYNGQSWSLFGLAGQTVTVVSANPLNANQVLAGTTAGAYYNGGPANAAWYPVNEELAPYTVQSISVSAQRPDYGYIGTTTRGVVKLKLPR